MASMTIRHLDDGVIQALEAQAARKGGVSAEDKARQLLGMGVKAFSPAKVKSETAWEILQRIKNETGGFDVELELPDRSQWKMRPVDFGE